METLAELLTAWRQTAGLSQEEAADRCGMTRSAWGMAEQGRRTRLYDESFRLLSVGTGIDETRLRRAATYAQIAKLQDKLQPTSATPPKEPALAHS